MDSNPKLSICIPTYNRSHLLRDSLQIVIPQLKEFGDRVELIVSDNCSSDDTESIVEELSQEYPIRYFRNDKNYGANQNILFFMQSRAHGEFCWILGDDDHVREDGIRNIMDILDRNKDIDFLFVNFLHEALNEARKNSSVIEPKPHHYFVTPDHQEGRKTFDEIIANDVLSLTGIFTSVFRVSVCRESAQKYLLGPEFTNLRSTFPVAIILIDTMRGHLCYSSGEPWLIIGTKTSWSRHIFIGRKRFLDLYDYEEKAGIDQAQVEVQRRRFLLDQSTFLPETWLLFKLRKNDVPFIGEFDPFGFMLENFVYKEFWVCWLYHRPRGFLVNRIMKRISSRK
jgi:glycosyltransferase involved in cell wall biosynthesis